MMCYFMFQPPGDDSIWITLAVVYWGWKGTAVQGATQMTLASGSIKVPYVNTTRELPEWTGRFTTLVWQ